ncbi:hypothetical protein ABW19_dt0203046 [Dactylella cylindrospora]|nr:hypothetical protein ABW19_dt0203046 [Dactylella cylindrospora]
MNSAKQLNQRKLQHLHNASQILFPASPTISAHLASRLNVTADAAGIQLAESTWRKTCACCGYALVPGWTASVRARGIGDDGLSASWKKQNQKDRDNDGEIVSNNIVPKDTDAKVWKVSQRTRKRGKRTRGNKRVREKTEGPDISHEINLDESSEGNSSLGAAPKRSRTKKVSTKSNAGGKEPRIVYACKVCDRKTTHILPIKSIANEPSNDKVQAASMEPSDNRVLESKAASAEPPKAPVATNSTAKKRAKSRKNTLSEMLAKEQANRAAASSTTSGFGLDLMDFMKTT